MERIAGFLGDLEASFEGSIERQESEAADDLAASMRQDLSLYERLLGWRGARVVDGPPDEVRIVAADHLVLGDPPSCIVRPEAVRLRPVVPRSGASLRRTDDRMCMSLRAWARTHSRVEVEMLTGRVAGRLHAAAPDHVVLRGAEATLIPYGVIRWISLSPEG